MQLQLRHTYTAWIALQGSELAKGERWTDIGIMPLNGERKIDLARRNVPGGMVGAVQPEREVEYRCTHTLFVPG